MLITRITVNIFIDINITKENISIFGFLFKIFINKNRTWF